MKNWFKANSAHLIVIAIFIALVSFYFTPVWQGKTLAQSDVVQAQGGQKELFDYKAKDGKAPLWTNSMFGGMPTYQIWQANENNIGTYVLKAVKFVFPPPMDTVLFYLLGAYLLFSVLRIRPWLAAVGAIAIAFTSYNFIYIEAGHITRANAIAFIPPVLAAVIMCYRGSKLWGPVLLALFLSLEIRVNHLQTTYYLLMALMVYVIFTLVDAIRQKQLKEFFIASGRQVLAVAIAIMVNASILLPTWEYSKLSTRGHANITKVDDNKTKEKGLDKQYAYEWSQGVGESMTFVIPNAYGGANGGQLDEKSHVAKFFMEKGGMPAVQAGQIAEGMPTYWGDKPFTSGPWYFGAGIFFLFVLGLIIVKNRLKWWILATTLLALLLSFGKNFTLVSDLFFDYFPMYNKFRAVESILVLVSITVPLMAVLTVNELLTRAKEIPNLEKKVLYTFVGVGGFCLLIGLLPDLFLNFRNAEHNTLIESFTQQIGDKTTATELVNQLVLDRKDIASKDAYRSFAIILLTFGLIWFYLKKKLSEGILLGTLLVLFLFDLWSVDKRFLNDRSFMDKGATTSQVFQQREVDQLILMDKDPSYRVLDLTTNPFSDARASYFHKSLGGYHAAKLMRFQEILENQFNGALNEDVLDMFNVRYLITTDQQNQSQRIVRRSTAAGNAWFVDKVSFVKGNAEEMQAINSFDPRKEAFVNQQYQNEIKAKTSNAPTTGEIKLTSYHPDKMQYEYTTANDAFAVFSEVFYDKGWKAFVDGKETPIIRADYLLRALQLPAGTHKVEFIFDPESHKMGNILTLISSIILGLGVVAAIYFSFKGRQKETVA
ncbi:YfhO family protein [Sphingobacterium sp. N143]|uniref:YfhO family protein n=1 Tax=Sphingobacterium sp. N143 TaxID=2746727 RepID=UPI0025756A6A|nr:YfhO family protein [Sphingobacterium sp. N143]MDM1296777.1 YfhO family protein [Sphingobacterium sp. N143]